VSVDWLTADPGDHIRVLTLASAVPEPETWALLVAGVAALAWRARRTTVPRASRR
jgi:PEP-CTERM motif